MKTINTGTVVLEADGASSVLNISALTGFTEANGWTNSTLQASNGGTVDDSSLTTLSNVNLSIGGASTIGTAQLTSYTGGSMTIDGGSPSFAALRHFHRQQYHGQRRGNCEPAQGSRAIAATAATTRSRRPARQHADPGQPGDRDRELQQLPGPGHVRGPGRRHGELAGAARPSIPARSSWRPTAPAACLNIAALTGFTEANGWTYSTLQASNGGTVETVA